MNFDWAGVASAEMAARTTHGHISEAELRALVFAPNWDNSYDAVRRLIEDARSDPARQTELSLQAWARELEGLPLGPDDFDYNRWL